MIKVFIGSSTEIKDSGALAAIHAAAERALPPGTEIRDWPSVFRQGHFTLEVLREETQRCDFAILVLAPDDVVTKRGTAIPITRANVLLESGMFLSALGARRVAHVVVAGVDVPSDLAGVVTINVDGLGPDKLDDAAKRIETQLGMAWGRPEAFRDLGLSRTLRKLSENIAKTRQNLLLDQVDNQSDSAPIILDSSPVREAYHEALQQVQERFWTTTYLTSGFWTTNAEQAVQANREMLRRIPATPRRSIRRIFLLPRSAKDLILDDRQRLVRLRDRGEDAVVERTLAQIRTHERNVRELNADGCETRVAYDHASFGWDLFNNVVQAPFRPGDTELAIYDDFRVDIFNGGATGAVDRVICYVPHTTNFPSVVHITEAYLNRLWDSGLDALTFISEWRESSERAADSISYEPLWQWKYDHNLNKSDSELKDLEFSAVTKAILKLQSQPKSYLDIGTCTGRYPSDLISKKILPRTTNFVALDADPHCCDTTKVKLSQNNISTIGVICEDFLLWTQQNQRKFDLITCMLGTVSHFSSPTLAHKDGSLEEAITAMKRHLNFRGVLMLGTWSGTTIRHQDFLGIYSNQAKTRLSRWSPNRETLTEIFNSLGFTFELVEVNGRLDLWVCHNL